MENLKRKAINEIIDSNIKSFANGFEVRHIKEVNDPNGVINSKKNNIFMAELGEGNEWKQSQVRQYFDKKELLIGKDYWNFVCDDENGFEMVFEQYKKSANYIKDAISNIKALYF